MSLRGDSPIRHIDYCRVRCVSTTKDHLGGYLPHRLFPGFPGGLQGFALLLLRWVLCAALLLQGGLYLNGSDPPAPAWAVGLVALVTGSMLLVGFFTPIAASLAALYLASTCAFPLAASGPNLFRERFTVILSITVLIAVTLLGPGAFSVDARRFGRRKIIIPGSGSRR